MRFMTEYVEVETTKDWELDVLKKFDIYRISGRAGIMGDTATYMLPVSQKKKLIEALKVRKEYLLRNI